MSLDTMKIIAVAITTHIPVYTMWKDVAPTLFSRFRYSYMYAIMRFPLMAKIKLESGIAS